MSEQERLFRLGLEAVHVSCIYRFNRGWLVTLSARRQGEMWSEGHERTYSDLSRDELVQVVGDELITVLGL